MASDKHGPYAELGQLLLDLRHQMGWSLRQAAKEIGGLSHSRLQDFERGLDPHSAIPTRPSAEQLSRMAKAYRTEPGKLLRLAGYSSVGELTEWEERLLIRIRGLSDTARSNLDSFVDSLGDQSE